METTLAYIPYIEFFITLLGIVTGVLLSIVFATGFNYD